MRVPLKWLAEYVDLVLDAEELAELLTASGTSVEGVEKVSGGWTGCVVGRILEVSPHPSADRLIVCRVDVGGATRDIVCGAPNVRPGMISPVALPGSRLPDGKAIGEAEIRGVVSSGMLLSERELGISDDAAGIMELDEGLEPGRDLSEALDVEDIVLVLEITPNRPDCLSMLGVAREVAALTGREVRRPQFSLVEEGEPTAAEVKVEILEAERCPRYVARLIEEVRIGPAPWWMRNRLRAAGMRPINNVVDVTNYVMLELGQPLHAFDYHLLREGHIIVRCRRDGERLTTLDGVERELHPEDLLICDPDGPVALAGVMGGENTEVNPGTVKVLLESAHFSAPGIMLTSRRHDLSSEAAYRFERGVDPAGCLYAADRAAFLMREIAGGKVRPGAVDVVARPEVLALRELRLRVQRAARLIGISLSASEARRILESLELEVYPGEESGEASAGGEKEGSSLPPHVAGTAGGGEVLQVKVPTFRPDLEREIDLVEELARIYGYQRVPATLPRTPNNVGFLTREQRLRREIARIMVGCGLHEAITWAFIPSWWMDLLDPQGKRLPKNPLRLRNPLSEEASVMRSTLLPGLLEAARFNLNRRIADVHLFEMGRVFVPEQEGDLPREPLLLGCLVTGRWMPKDWDQEPVEADFFVLKGILETLARALHVEEWSLRRSEYPFLHPARSAEVMLGDRVAGYLGTLHPRLVEALDIKNGVEVMELDVSTLVEAARTVPPYRDIPRFPSVQMDLAVVVREEVDAAEVEGVIREAGGELLREVRLFDLYRGGQLAEGEKSLAYALVFYALDRTLRDEEAHQVVERIVKALGERLGARLR
ncbi:phenylalanine--tRNA ligase subunit beta [Candidatus Solincola sp.]